jgi:hypothetical protein
MLNEVDVSGGGERTGLCTHFLWILVEMLASAKSSESRTASLLSDMDHLEVAIVQLQDLLSKISTYVDNVVVCNKSGWEL